MSARRLKPDELKQLALKAAFKPCKLARLLHISPKQLRRDFHRELHDSPIHCLRELRASEAKKSILRGEPEKEIAHRLGFTNQAHLSNEIRNFYGVCARDLKRNGR